MDDERPLRILIVDDHVMVRLGLVTLIADEPGLVVAGQARNGAEACRLFEELLPDLVLLDGNLPDMHGTEVTRCLLSKHPDARIVIISINETPEDIHLALEAGAKGYVPKSHDQDVIVQAVREVGKGNVFLPGDLALRLSGRMLSTTLSHREIEVLGLIAKGKANKEIADGLGLSANTVKTHIVRILGKLNAPDRTRAVTIAIERGLLRL